MNQSPADCAEYRLLLGSTPVRKTKRERIEGAGIYVTPQAKHCKFSASSNHSSYNNLESNHDLPDEIWIYILRYVPMMDLVNVSRVNSLFHVFSRDNCVWKRHYLDLFYGGRRHAWKTPSISCEFTFAGPTNSIPICTQIIHYVNPSDGKTPKYKNRYYERTLERLYYLLIASIEKYKSDIQVHNTKEYVSQSQYETIVKEANSKKKIIDKRFIQIFKKLYPSKYKK